MLHSDSASVFGVLFRSETKQHFIVLRKAEALVDGLAELGGVQGDGLCSTCTAMVDGGLEQQFGVALATCFGRGIEVEQVGTERFGVQEVGRKVRVEDAGGGEALAILFKQQADVATVRQTFAHPQFEVAVHGVQGGFAGNGVVCKHAVALGCDASGIVRGGDPDLWHKCTVAAAKAAATMVKWL